MGRKKKNATSKAESSLPEDVVVEILSRLPLDSLIRFTCVSKQWRSLISHISATKKSLTVLLVYKSGVYPFSPHSIDQRQQQVKVKIYVPWDMIKYNYGFQFLGSCNGLLLVHIGEEDLFLWNPMTRFFKKVLSYFRLADDDYRVSSGLCYDSTTDDYKAVLSLSHQTPDYGGEFVMVGSFKSKCWTEIDIPYMVNSMNSGPIVNGNLHWFASKNDLGTHFLSPHQIIYFIQHMDRFEEVPMSEPRGEDGDIICALGVLDGCLCMSRFNRPGDSESNIEVLIMKEYSVKNSWTIRFVVSHGSSFPFNHYDEIVPLGYTKNGAVIVDIGENYGWHLWALNLNDNFHTRISIAENRCFRAIVHEESLITPTDYGWEEEEHKGEATYVEVQYGCRTRKMKKDKYGCWTYEFIES